METKNIESEMTGMSGGGEIDQMEKKVSERKLAKMMNGTSNELKVMMLGGVLAFLGCFLPWWKISTTGTFATTHTINAFNDATFLMGFVVFLGAVFSLVMSLFEMNGKKPKWMERTSHSFVQMLIGGEMSLLMLMILSIYTSPRFSSEATSGIAAGVSWGAFVTFLGAVMILMGGWLEWKGSGILKQKLQADNQKQKRKDELRIEPREAELSHEENEVEVHES